MNKFGKYKDGDGEILDQILAYLLSNKIIFLESDKDEVLEKLKLEQDRLKRNKVNENSSGNSSYSASQGF